MSWLIMGLLLFLGPHSVRIVAEGWRGQTIARVGEKRWKGLYSLVSVAGFILLIWGYGQARLAPIVLWVPPLPMRHIAGLLMLVALIMLTATYVPGNAIKARLKHPMILSVKVWALAHLLSNGNLADVVLFGAFLLWAILDFRSARRRDPLGGAGTSTSSLSGNSGRTLLTVAIGLVAWAVFAFWGHERLIGVAPMGM
jgi:uncharacterized membrane protein